MLIKSKHFVCTDTTLPEEWTLCKQRGAGGCLMQFTCTDTLKLWTTQNQKLIYFNTSKQAEKTGLCLCYVTHLLLKENNGSSSSSKSRQDSMVWSKLGNQSVHGHVFLCSGREVVKSEMLNKHWNCFEDGLAQKKTERITATGHLIKELPVHKQGVVWFGQLTS